MAARVESLDSRRRSRRGALTALPAPPPRDPAPLPALPHRPRAGWRDLLRRVADGVWTQATPDLLRELDEEIAARLRRMPTRTNEFGFDPWGLNVDTARQAMVICALLYRYYFRVQTFGIEHIPEGRTLVISNHAGQVAIDAAMIGTATLLEREPPRIVRGMGSTGCRPCRS
ncbi:MAG: hypothetical protein U0802_25480 [Candidatus Binatia bacterium]